MGNARYRTGNLFSHYTNEWSERRFMHTENNGVYPNLALSTTKTKDEVQGGLLLDVVVRQGTPILKLLAGED